MGHIGHELIASIVFAVFVAPRAELDLVVMPAPIRIAVFLDDRDLLAREPATPAGPYMSLVA